MQPSGMPGYMHGCSVSTRAFPPRGSDEESGSVRDSAHFPLTMVQYSPMMFMKFLAE